MQETAQVPNKHPVQHPPSSSRVATCSRRADDARQSQQLGFGNWELPSWETLGAGRRAAGLLRWPGGRRRRRDRGRREPERRKAGDGQRLDGRRRAGHAATRVPGGAGSTAHRAREAVRCCISITEVQELGKVILVLLVQLPCDREL